MLNWATQFNIFCLLDNKQYQIAEPAFDCLLAAGARFNITLQAGEDALGRLKTFQREHPGWLFGHIGYDIKNEIEQLQSDQLDTIGFPDAHFFIPQTILRLQQQQLWIETIFNPQEIFDEINSCSVVLPGTTVQLESIKSRFSHEDYIDTVEQLKHHILRGDCYEINFCQEFYVEQANISPALAYHQLTERSPNPFAAFYRLNSQYCLCASPERYFKKTGNRVISQPIKGTAPRVPNNAGKDLQNKLQLQQSEKERSENVMVVDLVRNDLSRICLQGTVQVDELFGVYSFPQVHQLISTVSGEVAPHTTWIDIVKATFPMASMTGAPKKKVMELIERYERTKRGLFSGAIGYVAPDGDADFNVVIRSILYNAANKYLSFPAGSAITNQSDPEMEYRECLLKTAGIREVLATDQPGHKKSSL